MARKGRYIGFHGLNLVFLMSKVIQHGFFIKKFVLHTGSHCIHGRQWPSHVGAEGGLRPPPTLKFFIKKLVDIFVNSDPSKFIPSKENILLAPSFPAKILYICIISIYCILKESIK